MVYKIAITGGIGSGKSVALKILKDLGCKTFSCDKISRTIYRDAELKDNVREIFGEEVFSSDGRVLRKRLAKKVFSDKALVKALNELTHCKIRQKLLSAMDRVKGVAVAEVPLLFESGMQNDFDKVIILMRDETVRFLAVSERDGLSQEQIERRMANQIDYNKLDKTAYTVICNDGDIESLRDKLRCVVEGL